MGFQQGLSGLRASSTALDVTSNNVANSATVGFKAAQAHFADVYADSLSGTGASQIGIGVGVASIQQNFATGSITATSNPLDIAINGGGFFRMSDNGALTYSRNGQFHLDKSGYVVNSEGLHLTGYQTQTNATTGAVSVSGVLGDIQVNSADIPPVISSTSSLGANLDSRDIAPTTPLGAGTLSGTAPNYDPPDPSTYNRSTSETIYDSLGNAHSATFYFVKDATAANTWHVLSTVDGGKNNLGAITPVADLHFTTSGILDEVATPPAGLTGTPTSPVTTTASVSPFVTWDPATIPVPGQTPAQDLKFDFAGSTQFGSTFSVNKLEQNGYTAGRLTGLNVSGDGTILGSYSNNQFKTIGQVALSKFTNPNGLVSMGGNQWTESSASGQPLTGAPNSSRLGLGVLQSSAVEESNVDLTAELVNMIVEQRNYQANAQSIKTQDQLLNTLVNLR